jgi:hypothetical protein
MRNIKRDIVFLTMLIYSLTGISQWGTPFPGNGSKEFYDSIGKLQTNRMNILYLEKTGIERALVDGKDYFPYYYRSQNKPLLRYNEERSASLIIHERSFSNLVLQYDTYTDELIYSDDHLIFNNRICQVSLNKNEVSSFDLYFRHDTLHFRYFSKDNDRGFGLDDGFYEVVYEGETEYLIRHKSSVYQTIDKIDEYSYKPVSYIKITNGFSEITSKEKFIALFGKKSDNIRHFLRQKRIRIQKAAKKQISEVLKYFESLPETDG